MAVSSKAIFVAACLSLASLAGCTSKADPDDGAVQFDNPEIERLTDTDAPTPPMTSDDADEQAADALSGDSFEDVGDTSQCTDDCSGHDAGFEWAKDNDVTDSSDCGGKSTSFIEGCEAYADAVEERSSSLQEE